MSNTVSNSNDGRILAVDYGTKRIGIAISDPLNLFAIPLITLQNDSDLIKNIKNIFSEYKIQKVILGLPYRADGTEGEIAGEIIKFSKMIEKLFKIKTEFVDERYSSIIAQRQIVQTVVSKKKRRVKGLIDNRAAAVILNDYLGN